MGRTKVVVDRNEFTSVIKRLENSQTFANISELADKVSQEMSIDISPAIVKLRIKEFGVDLKTKKGKRGRPSGPLTEKHKKAMQAGRKSKRVVGNIVQLRKDFPDARQKLLDKVESGSLVAATKANCLSCSQFVIEEIRHCQCFSCPLHSFRPYQK